MPANWFLPVMAFLAVALATVAAVMMVESVAAARRRRDVLRRLESAADPHPVEGEDAADLFRSGGARREEAGPLANLPHLKDLGNIFDQAGVKWTVTGYLVGVTGLAVAMGLLGLLSGSLLLALGMAFFGASLPFLYLRRRRKKRLDRFEEQFPEAIDLLGRAIRAGHPLSAGIRMVAEEGPDTAAVEFRHVFDEQRFGLPFDEALIGLADRVPLVDVRILVTAVLIQREVGGNLAEILDKISQTIRARFAIRRQLRTYTAQGRISGYVLAAMPIVVGLAIFGLERSYVMMLFEEPLGRALVGIAVTAQIIGYLWIRKIVNIEI